ncbi:MAG: type III pantothenate kinase [bacterium]|nr:type III pantothenate kinase [bacterium]
MASSKRLVLDAGNSTLHFGWFDGLELLKELRLPTRPLREAAFYRDQLAPLVAAWGPFEVLIYASVVPSIAPLLESLSKDLGFALKPVTPAWLEAEGLVIATEGTGIDRLLTAWAAWQRYGRDLVVVDLGTATTFDVINQAGTFLGGAIFPGLELCRKALAESAEGLYEVPLEFPTEIIGKNTKEALQSGILLGYSSLVETMLEKIAASHGAPIFRVATGGLADLMYRQTANLDALEPGLTLLGLARLAQR